MTALGKGRRAALVIAGLEKSGVRRASGAGFAVGGTEIEMLGGWARGSCCPKPIDDATLIGEAVEVSATVAVPEKSNLPLVLVEAI